MWSAAQAAAGFAGRRLAQPYSQFPGGAAHDAELANARQVILADFDADNRTDIFLHAPAPSAGSCAMRCHEERRFGFDSFEVRHTNAASDDEAAGSWCYCGPHYDLMIGCVGRFEPAQLRAPDALSCFFLCLQTATATIASKTPSIPLVASSPPTNSSTRRSTALAAVSVRHTRFEC